MRNLLRVAVGFLFVMSNEGHSSQYNPFKSEVDGFIRAGASQGLPIDMSDFNVIMAERLPSNVVGLCVPYEHIVLVSAQYWSVADKIHREALVWHELGHCMLNRMHVSDMKDGHAVSLMYPSINSVDDEKFYTAHRNEYIKELFSPQPPDRLFHSYSSDIIAN